jgi:hypothetical protein
LALRGKGFSRLLDFCVFNRLFTRIFSADSLLCLLDIVSFAGRLVALPISGIFNLVNGTLGKETIASKEVGKKTQSYKPRQTDQMI